MTKWISLKDRKPEHGQEVLITNGVQVTAAVADRKFFNGKNCDHVWWDCCNIIGHDCEFSFDEDSITHWMPIPMPMNL